MKSKQKSNIFLFGFISLLTDISSRMILSVLPLFLIFLGTKGIFIGVIEGVSDFAAAVLKTFFGWLSDRYGKRKWFIIIGYIFSNVVKPLYALVNSWQGVMLIRVGDRIGNGIRKSSRDALLSESARKAHMGRTFGFVKGMDKIGASIGTLIALLFVLYSHSTDFRLLFWLAAVPGIGGSLLTFLLNEPEKKTLSPRKRIGYKFDLKGIDWRFKFFITAVFIYAIANFSYMFFLLKAKEMIGWGGAKGNTPEVITKTIFVYLIFNITYSLFSFISGKLADTIGRWQIFLIGEIAFAIMALGFTLFKGMMWAWLLIIIYGFTQSGVMAVGKSLVAELTPKDKRGIGMGFYNTMNDIGKFLASPIAGSIWISNMGSNGPFYLASILSLISAAIISFTFLKGRYNHSATN